jgi:hypothetical protein
MFLRVDAKRVFNSQFHLVSAGSLQAGVTFVMVSG